MTVTRTITPVVLCGGGGTRLWPLSRGQYPKQFLPLLTRHSLLQDTLLRLDQRLEAAGGMMIAPAILVTIEDYRFLVADHARAVQPAPFSVLVEPVARNTAAAVVAATIIACESGEDDPLVVVLPADHAVRDTAGFRKDLERAAELADEGRIVCFGIVPDRPETGYGYIQKGASLGPGAAEIQAFREKPSFDVAREYVARGDFYWNSGMFVFRASTLIRNCSLYAPEILDGVRRSVAAQHTRDLFTFLDEGAYAELPSISFDIALMEKVECGAVVVAGFDWSDVGSWDALKVFGDPDQNGNILKGRTIAIGSHDSFVQSEGPVVALLGVDELMVVATPDAVLVAAQDASQDVRTVVTALRSHGFPEADLAKTVARPWGTYTQVDDGWRYQVKRLTVAPGRKLSLQLHYHRAEHWIVVQGTAEVTCGDKIFLLYENQSTYIPPGTVHRLANPGKIPLHLIEVQSGSYLEEDDIVRYQDDFGR